VFAVPTVYDVPPDALIARVAEYIKKNRTEVTPPAWAKFVKTGAQAERPPQNPDWWFIRAASVLRKVYIMGPIGISRLRKEYGGRRRRGSRPDHFVRGGGAIIRKVLQQLEGAKLVKTLEKKGRVVTDEGRGLMDALAGKVKRKTEKKAPKRKAPKRKAPKRKTPKRKAPKHKKSRRKKSKQGG